jgi:outer membrane protein TolC
MKKATGAVILLILMAIIPAFSETRMTIDEIADYALENSREIENAIDSVRDAEEAAGGIFEFESSRLSVNGGYTFAPDAPIDVHSLSLGSSISVPIIPQVSVSGSIDQILEDQMKGSVSISVSPFAGLGSEWKEWESLRKAQIQLSSLEARVPMNAELDALDMVRTVLNLSFVEQSLALEESKFKIAQDQYELGDLNYSEYDSAVSGLSGARQKYYEAQKSLFTMQKKMYQVLGPGADEVQVTPVTVEEVLSMIRTRENELNEAMSRNPSSVSLLNTMIELEALNKQLTQTPAFLPNISLSANANFPFSQARASVSFSVSPNDIALEERDDIKQSIIWKRFDLEVEQQSIELEKRMLEKSLAVAEEALLISQNSLDAANRRFEENKYLHDLGQTTDIELEQSELSVFSSEINLFRTSVDLYRTLGDFLLLYINL